MINMFHSGSWFPVICFGAHRKTSFWVVPLGPLGGSSARSTWTLWSAVRSGWMICPTWPDGCKKSHCVEFIKLFDFFFFWINVCIINYKLDFVNIVWPNLLCANSNTWSLIISDKMVTTRGYTLHMEFSFIFIENKTSHRYDYIYIILVSHKIIIPDKFYEKPWWVISQLFPRYLPMPKPGGSQGELFDVKTRYRGVTAVLFVLRRTMAIYGN